MKVYPKNSFDRLGDDLTELILQYLTFEDKVRLECVSKQWRRLVFNKQFGIEILDTKSEHMNNFRQPLTSNIEERLNSLNKLLTMLYNGRQLDVESFESVLKKCPNIKHVNIEVNANNKVFLLIGRYCIKSLKFRRIYPSIRKDTVLSFFRINGHKLEELCIYESVGVTDDYYRHCTNLKVIILSDSSLICNEDKEFLPKLEEIRIPNIYRDFNHLGKVNKMKILSDNKSQTMKTLDIPLRYLTAEELKTCIECIARFENF